MFNQQGTQPAVAGVDRVLVMMNDPVLRTQSDLAKGYRRPPPSPRTAWLTGSPEHHGLEFSALRRSLSKPEPFTVGCMSVWFLSHCWEARASGSPAERAGTFSTVSRSSLAVLRCECSGLRIGLGESTSQGARVCAVTGRARSIQDLCAAPTLAIQPPQTSESSPLVSRSSHLLHRTAAAPTQSRLMLNLQPTSYTQKALGTQPTPAQGLARV